MDAAELHQALVDNLKQAGTLTDGRVEAAFRAVPRHFFLPQVPLERVYSDEAIVTKRLNDRPISSSSQPAIMAIMLEQLDVQPGQRVLEIGAGTGYNAALLAHLVGETGTVVSMDLDEDIVDDARRNLSAAGIDRVHVIHGDGGAGYAALAPYDRIILTVGALDITPAWRAQLKPEGRLVLPLSIGITQEAIAFDQADGYLISRSIKDCGFMLLRGAFAEASLLQQLSLETGLHFTGRWPAPIDPQYIYRLLTSPGQIWATGIQVSERNLWQGLSLWLDVHLPGFCTLWAEGDMVARGVIPCLLAFADNCLTHGTLNAAGLCLLMRLPAEMSDSPDSSAFELGVHNYGPDEQVALQLIQQITHWAAAGRPATDRLQIRAYPREAEYAPAGNEIVVQKRWTTLVLDWQS